MLHITAGELSPQMYAYLYAHKMLIFGAGLGIVLLLVVQASIAGQCAHCARIGQATVLITNKPNPGDAAPNSESFRERELSLAIAGRLSVPTPRAL
ncbi:MAG: hypothetical protein QOH31_3745 [Verrucomicrobiota bacterium]